MTPIKIKGPKAKTATSSKSLSFEGFTKHGLNQKITRQVKSSDALDAARNPLKVTDVKLDHLGRPSQRVVGEKATLAINPNTGKASSVNPTSTKRAARYKRQLENL